MQHVDDLGFADAGGVSAGPGRDVAVLELSQHHAHGRDGAGIARLHGLFVGIVQTLAEHDFT